MTDPLAYARARTAAIEVAEARLARAQTLVDLRADSNGEPTVEPAVEPVVEPPVDGPVGWLLVANWPTRAPSPALSRIAPKPPSGHGRRRLPAAGPGHPRRQSRTPRRAHGPTRQPNDPHPTRLVLRSSHRMTARSSTKTTAPAAAIPEPSFADRHAAARHAAALVEAELARLATEETARREIAEDAEISALEHEFTVRLQSSPASATPRKPHSTSSSSRAVRTSRSANSPPRGATPGPPLSRSSRPAARPPHSSTRSDPGST